MKHLFLTIVLATACAALAKADGSTNATLYKNPNCACCDAYADYLRSHGFKVSVIEHPNMSIIKQKYGVREKFEGCHSTVIGDYVIEGHVPVAPIKRLLTEKPKINGISLPGMPLGSPGMNGSKDGPFEILTIADENETATVFATE